MSPLELIIMVVLWGALIIVGICIAVQTHLDRKARRAFFNEIDQWIDTPSNKENK